MASLLSAVRTRFFDKSNKPLAGGKVYTYEANSTNPKVTWSDEALTVQNTNPVLLDNEGTALIFFSGKYRFRIVDQFNVLVEDNPSVTSGVGIDGVTADIVKYGDTNQEEFNDAQTVKNKENASLSDYVDGTSSDVSLSLEEALANNSLRITDGEYYINNAVVVTKDQAINFDLTAKMNFGPNGRLNFSGSSTLINKPLANIIRGTNTLTVSHSGQIKRGDLICIHNPNNGSFNPELAYYKAGEFVEVARVSGDTITVLGKFYEAYDSSIVDIYRISPITVDLSKLNINVDETNPNPAVVITFGRDCVISQPKSAGGMYQNLMLDRCYNTTIYGNATSCLADVTPNGLQYGLILANCQKGRIFGGNFNASRHGIALGSSSAVCNVPVRNLRIMGASLQNFGAAAVGAADMHGNCDDVQYIDCQLDGAHMAGKNTKIVNSRVTATTTEASGWAIYSSHSIGGTWDLEDVTIDTTGDGVARGIVYIALTQDLTEDLHINIKNLTVECSPKAIDTLIQVVVSNGIIITKKVNIKIDGVRVLNATSLTNLLRFSYSNIATTTQIPSDYISIEDISVPTGTKLLYTANLQAATKLRMPEVSGAITVNTGDGAQYRVAGTELTLPYIYPRVPNVFTQLSPVNNGVWNDDALNSGVTSPPFAGVYGYIHNRQVDKLTVGLYSTGKYLTANRSYSVLYRVGIKDV